MFFVPLSRQSLFATVESTHIVKRLQFEQGTFMSGQCPERCYCRFSAIMSFYITVFSILVIMSVISMSAQTR